MTHHDSDRLFNAARNAPVETTLQQVAGWVDGAVAGSVASVGSEMEKSVLITKKTSIMVGGSLAGVCIVGMLAFWVFSVSGPDRVPADGAAGRNPSAALGKGSVSREAYRTGHSVMDTSWSTETEERGQEGPVEARPEEAWIGVQGSAGIKDAGSGSCDEGEEEGTASLCNGAGDPMDPHTDVSARRSVQAANQDLLHERREVGEFNELVLLGVMDLTIRQGEQREVVVEGTAEQQERVEISTKGKTLALDSGRHKANSQRRVPGEKAVRVIVTVTELNGIKHLGVGDIVTEGALKQVALKIDFSGVGDMDLHLRCEDLQISYSGVGDTKLAGKAGLARLDYSGVGDLDALMCPMQKMDVSVSGVGMAKVKAIDELNVEFSGVGGVLYEGEPKTKSIRSFGVGKVRRQ